MNLSFFAVNSEISNNLKNEDRRKMNDEMKTFKTFRTDRTSKSCKLVGWVSCQV